jgi:hypothetical protein
VADIDRLC